MSRELIGRRWDLVGRLAFLVVLCFAAEMLVYVVQVVVGGIAGPERFGSTGAVATLWRWLAWGPALVYLAAVLVSLPLPRVRGRDTRWSAGGRMRIPPIGRGALLFFGVLVFFSTSLHAVSFLPVGDPVPTGPGYVAVFMVGAIGLLVLRIVLGALRLLPRSWRIVPESEPASPATGVVLPEQRFAPGREGRA